MRVFITIIKLLINTFCLNVLYRDAPSSGHNGQIYGTERNAVVCYYYLNDLACFQNF